MKFPKHSLLTDLVDAAPMGVSMILSFSFTLLITRSTSLHSFVTLQIGYAIGSLAVWMLDFGLLRATLMYLATDNQHLARSTWSSKFYIYLIVQIPTLFLSFLFTHSFIVGFVLIACSLDILTDSFVTIRIIYANKRRSFLIPFFKKTFQIFLVFTFLTYNHSIDLFEIALSLVLPSFCIYVYEIWKFPLLAISKIHRQIFRKSFPLWMQSGGTIITNFDYLILGASNALVIASMTIGKKIYGALAVVSLGRITKNFHDTAQEMGISKKSILASLSLAGITAFPATFIILFSKEVIRFFFVKNFSTGDLLTFQALILTIPLGVLTANINSILTGLSKFKYASITTFGSSSVYLLMILFAKTSHHPEIFVPLAVLTNVMAEIFLGFFFIFYKLRGVVHG